MEKFISGYCRACDQSRMVEVEIEDGKLLDVDCGFANCPFRPACTIASSIEALLQESN